MTGPYRMSHPKPNDDAEPVPGDQSLPEAVPRQPSPEDDPIDDGEDEPADDVKA